MYNAPSSMEDVNVQKEIQQLKWKTQEALAESRIEIERLEDENESKNHRIQEIEQEIAEVEEEAGFGNMVSLRDLQMDAPSSKGAKKRWSFMANSKVEPELDPEGHQANEMHPRDTPERQSFGRRMSLGGLKGKHQSFRGLSFGGQKKEKKIAKEENLMQRFYSIQEESKKAIEKHQNDLTFKEQQVLAMKMTFESQEQIIARLQGDVAKLKTDHVPQPPVDNTPGKIASMESLMEKLSVQTGRANELEASLRDIRLIHDMDDFERKTSFDVLRNQVEESRARLKSLKGELRAKADIAEREVVTWRKMWMGLSVHLGLMERVSQKCIQRLEQKALDGDVRFIPTILERATRALDEELTMREHDSDQSATLRQESELMERLANVIWKCGTALVEGITSLQAKELSEECVGLLQSALEILKEGMEIAQSSMDTMLISINALDQSYERDNTLLADDVQEDITTYLEALAKKAAASEDEEGDAFEENDTSQDFDHVSEAEISEDDQFQIEEQEEAISKLHAREGELQEKMEVLSAKIIETKNQETKDEEEWSSKKETIQLDLESLRQEWSYKDQLIGVAVVKVEALKHREDLLREILEAATARGENRLRADV
jgi:hypothetical protein